MLGQTDSPALEAWRNGYSLPETPGLPEQSLLLEGLFRLNVLKKDDTVQ